MSNDEEFDELKHKSEESRARFEEWRRKESRRLSELLGRDELRTAPASSRKGVIGMVLPDTIDAVESVSLERYSALERIHGMMCALVDLADLLADRTVPEARAAEAVSLVSALQEKLWGRTLEMVAVLSLIDRIERSQREVARGMDLEEAVSRTIWGMDFVGFPQVTDALQLNEASRDAVRAAIRDWAEGTGHWKPVARAVELAGLGERDPESLRQQWAKWRHDPVRPPVIL
jgi:hypothetical protein